MLVIQDYFLDEHVNLCSTGVKYYEFTCTEYLRCFSVWNVV